MASWGLCVCPPRMPHPSPTLSPYLKCVHIPHSPGPPGMNRLPASQVGASWGLSLPICTMGTLGLPHTAELGPHSSQHSRSSPSPGEKPNFSHQEPLDTSGGSLLFQRAQTTLDHMHKQQPRSHGPRHRGSSAAAKSHSLPSPHRCLQPPPGRRQRQRPARAGPFSFLFIAGSVCSYRTRSPQSNLLAESLPESSLKPSCKNSFECK